MIAMLDENLALSCLFVHAGCFRVMRAVHSLYNVVVFKADLLAAICPTWSQDSSFNMDFLRNQ